MATQLDPTGVNSQNKPTGVNSQNKPTGVSSQDAGQDHNDSLETVLTSFNSNYQWNYGNLKTGLADLYEKAKREQWNGSVDLDWSIDVDPEGDIVPREVNPLVGYAPFEKLDERERARLGHAQISLQLSQFLHGEQGAMIVASQLVAAVPWMDAKYYASTQTMDEARHVEVFSDYLHKKLEWEWPINPYLKELLDITIKDSRWDFKYMGMQIIIEGLAMAAFGNLHKLTNEPLLKKLLHNVMRDESRHVAFGVMSLEDYYSELTATEMREREDFIIYACELMRNRLVLEEIADVMSWDREETKEFSMSSPLALQFRSTLFQRIVPNLKRLHLLTPRVRDAFTSLDIIRFENEDPTAQDRELGFA